ncbi:MAG: hypothetical protein GY821_01815 [Gammaproteobacteria bacterium]|nr:hypothetical protein [Gammaproteobacteria bacterium]
MLPPDMEVYKVESLPFQQVHPAPPAPKTVTFTRSRFHEASSIETAVTYSELYGPFFSAQYTQRFGPWAALSLLGEGGQNQYRANATVGVQLPAHQLAKVTIDHLGQRMDFNFASQDDTTWVSQTAYGAAYQFLRPHKFLNSLFVNGYWSQAQSKSLSAIRWIADNTEWENDRRIAGGTASTGEMGVKLLPFPRTLIGAAINYSTVQYPEHYNTTGHDDRGIGGQLSLDQMLGSAVKLHLIASDRVPCYVLYYLRLN